MPRHDQMALARVDRRAAAGDLRCCAIGAGTFVSWSPCQMWTGGLMVAGSNPHGCAQIRISCMTPPGFRTRAELMLHRGRVEQSPVLDELAVPHADHVQGR